jgi:hypothetical protein
MKNVSMSSQKNDVWGTVCEELTQNGMVHTGHSHAVFLDGI